MERLPLDASTHLLVLTGSGASAESGLPTYRGGGDDVVQDLTTVEALRQHPARFWRYISARRADALRAAPNPTHRALAEVEQRLGDRFLLATQNVDGLHALAGAQRMVELHGSLFRTRCTVCARPPFADIRQVSEPPLCELCIAAGRGSPGAPPYLRPDVVLFGEPLPPHALERIEAFLDRAQGGRLVYLAVGTSGVVFPAAELVHTAWRAGAETWLVNLDPAVNTDDFDHFLQGPSGRLLPELLAP